jgi:GNAT superfamily N-acetyltransferase
MVSARAEGAVSGGGGRRHGSDNGDIPGVRIRTATEADIGEMHRIRMSVLENRLADASLVRPEHYRAMMVENGRGWVAEVGSRVAGFAVADLSRCNIWALFVDPTQEGRGIGRELHDRMLDWLFGSGAEQVWLSTDPATRAERFYRRAGWAATGEQSGGEVRFEISRAAWRAASARTA